MGPRFAAGSSPPHTICLKRVYMDSFETPASWEENKKRKTTTFCFKYEHERLKGITCHILEVKGNILPNVAMGLPWTLSEMKLNTRFLLQSEGFLPLWTMVAIDSVYPKLLHSSFSINKAYSPLARGWAYVLGRAHQLSHIIGRCDWSK